MSTKIPSNRNTTNSSSGISACRYAPGTSKTPTARFSLAKTDRTPIKASFDTVGDEDSSLGTYLRCGRPSAHVLPFIFPQRFSFIKLTTLKASRFCCFVKALGSRRPITSMSLSCVYSFISAAHARSSNISKPFLADICVNMKFAMSLSTSSLFRRQSRSSVPMKNWRAYVFPSKLGIYSFLVFACSDLCGLLEYSPSVSAPWFIIGSLFPSTLGGTVSVFGSSTSFS
mmetsp:Transcript_34303/g.50919  ORF Transcript_34303/g.50919 Transcript_34303/m.50919 type:complete len:228 (-) Transcript_34303:109-792(-)